MAPSVKVIEEARVAVPPAAALPEQALFMLSPLDAQWITLPLIQRVLVFDGAGAGAIPPFDSVVASLRASLAETVAMFLPLAGRIVFLPSTGDAAIDCSEEGVAGGVRFVVAECDADAGLLAGEPDQDVAALELLAPVLNAASLPAETMAAQVTQLNGGGGGLAIGVALHHAVVDGRSVWRFLEAWAAKCRGADTCSATPAPTFDRAAVAIPGGEELARSVLRKYAPDLPLATVPQLLVEGRMKLARRTFTVAGTQIRRLKQHIAGLMSSPAPSSLSTFVAIAAIAWVSFVRSKHPSIISPDDEVYLFFFIDCRGRPVIDPLVVEGFFGTCISGCLAVATARDLLAEDDGVAVAAAASAVQKEARRAAADPLAGWEWFSLVLWIAMDRLVNISGSTRFPAYETTDFGWGSPSRTELVTMNHDGQVVLVAGKGADGGVQASVSLHPAHMDAFKSHFLNYLS